MAPFDVGPWLLYVGEGRFTVYVDPRNTKGAEHLRQFVEEILPNPERFEQEARGYGVTHVVVDTASPRMQRLGEHLAHTPAWRLVYQDSRHKVYAQRTASAG